MLSLAMGVILLAVSIYFLNVDCGIVGSKDDERRLELRSSLGAWLKPIWISNGMLALIAFTRAYLGV